MKTAFRVLYTETAQKHTAMQLSTTEAFRRLLYNI